MQTRCIHAVAACLAPGDIPAIAAALDGAGCALLAATHTAGDALRLVRERRPELLVADAILPGADGAGLARRVVSAPLNVYPAILLMKPPELRLPDGEALSACGAAVVEKPLTAAAVLGALATAPADVLPPPKARRLDMLLDALGLPRHPGREMLARAVALCWRDRRRLDNLRDAVYPDAGRPAGKSGAQAERAIRHVIDAAWRTGEIEKQHRIFGDTIDARRGRPTCGEMIAQLADILRWEG